MTEKRLVVRFQIELDPEILCGDDDLEQFYNGSWLKFMQDMYRYEGVFWDEKLKVVEAYIKEG